MDKVKSTIQGFVSKDGRHSTTVHETVAPHVQKETVNEQQREERHVARDREVHQDHHHTTVQPIHDQEILQEQHHHKATDVQHTTHDHRDHDGLKDSLAREKAQFQHETTRAPVQQNQSTAVPEVTGEHVHHHVHETIQPVVHKQTIEPHVVHSTVPIHETHLNKAQHHTATALPSISMDEFKNHGGALSGRETKQQQFDGEPHSLGKTIGNATDTTSVTGGRHGNNNGERELGAGHQGRHDGASAGDIGQSGTRHAGSATTNDPLHGTNAHGSSTNTGEYGTADQTGKKPSLMSKLNPTKDADGDGKKGFMD